MKKLILLFIAGVTLSASKPVITTYDIKTALEKKIIECKFKGNSNSPHYYQPIEINITNLTKKSINIRVPNGQMFITDSTDTQDVIITQEELIALSPQQNDLKPLFAMCTQQNKSASNESTIYSIGNQATSSLGELTKEIEKNKSFNTLGQYSVWALTDDLPLEEINGFDEKEAIHYQKYIANLLDIPLPINQPEDYKNYYETTTTLHRSIVGKFEYKIHKSSNITIGLFNDQDIIVRELYNNPSQKAGEHLFKYAFDLATYQDPKYYVRLIINGNIKVNLKMEPRKS